MVDLNRIATEQRNPDTMDIDRVSTLDMVRETENFDYDAYFRAFAYFFSAYQLREQVSPEGARNIHPYCYLRINFTVQHFDEFYRTYPSVTEGTPMYLAPEERILVW